MPEMRAPRTRRGAGCGRRGPRGDVRRRVRSRLMPPTDDELNRPKVQRLTDEDLARFENTSRDLHEGRAPVPALAAASQAGLVPILIAEVRRLRSDEWLKAVVEEIEEEREIAHERAFDFGECGGIGEAD